VLLWLVLQIGSAFMFEALEDELDFGTALYHCCITAATVGYGDVAMETQASRAFASIHILVSVSWLAALFAQIDKNASFRSAVLARAALLTRPLDRKRVVALAHDGKGVDRLEFVIGMLQILGVELCGEPLQWEDVRPFILKFDELDTMHHGRIDKRVLERFCDDDLTQTRDRVKKLGWSSKSLHRAETHYEDVMMANGHFLSSRMGEISAKARWNIARRGADSKSIERGGTTERIVNLLRSRPPTGGASSSGRLSSPSGPNFSRRARLAPKPLDTPEATYQVDSVEKFEG